MSDLTDQAGAEVKRELEQVANQAGSVAMRIANNGVHMVMNTGKRLTHKTLETLTRAAQKAMQQIPGLPGSPEHGRMKVNQLQRKSGGDLHATEVPKELVADLQKDLKKRGVDFAVEKGQNGNTFIHFKGKDTDSIKHALNQVKQKVEARQQQAKTPTAKTAKPDKQPQSRAGLKTAIETKAKQARQARTSAPKAKAPKLPTKGSR